MKTNTVNMKPQIKYSVFISLLLATLAAQVNAQSYPHWEPTITDVFGAPCGYSWFTHDFAAKDGVLYLMFGSQLSKWDACEWDWNAGPQAIATLGYEGGLGGPRTMRIFNGSLYVGGVFTSISPYGDPTGQTYAVTNIARLDLASQIWYPVGDGSLSGVANAIIDITVDAETNVYASLNVFSDTQPGYKDNPIPIVKCHGTSAWTELGQGLSLCTPGHWQGEICTLIGGVRALATDGTNIFAGGGFLGGINSDGTNVPSSGIIKWDGTSWQSMGNTAQVSGVTVAGIYDPVDPYYGFYITEVVVSGTNVFVSGNFADWTEQSVFSAAGQGLCRFSTSGRLLETNILVNSDCSCPYPTSAGYAYDLAAQPDGTVYVTGNFDQIDGNTNFQRIGQWTSSGGWTVLDSANGDLNLTSDSYNVAGGLLAADNDAVYVMGWFDTAGDQKELTGYARWVTGPNPDPYHPTAVLSRPALSIPNGTVTFNITGTPGSFWLIESSSDLVNWNQVSDGWVPLLTGSVNYTADLPWNSPIFFRARNNCTTSIPLNPYANQVATGTSHSLAIKPDGSGTVWNWGDGWMGELGNSDVVLVPDVSYAPMATVDFSNAVFVAAGNEHSLALKRDGTVWGWGLNFFGELGAGPGSYVYNGPGIYYYNPAAELIYYYYSYPTQAVGLSNVISIAAAGYHSIAAEADGSVWKWGNINNPSGNPYEVYQTPTKVANFTNAAVVSAGLNHTLILRTDGTVWAMGDNSSGQLGDGTTTSRHHPVQVANLSGVIAIAAGSANSYALTGDGKVWAWGAGSKNGDGTTTIRTTRVQVNNVANVIGISAGRDNGYAWDTNNLVWAWGYNLGGTIGNGTTCAYKLSPVPANTSASTTILALAKGGSSSHCLLTAWDMDTWEMILCGWGQNASGQIGDGTATTQTAPVTSVRFGSLVAPVLSGDPNSDDISWTFNGDTSNLYYWRIEQYVLDGNGGGSWQLVEEFDDKNQTAAYGVGQGWPMRIIGLDSSRNNVTQYSNIVDTL